jgi:hypothetical protein
MGGKGSGGRRPGAGRRPSIDDITTRLIGSEYTNRCNTDAGQKARRLLDEALEKRGYYENLADIKHVPVGVICSKSVCVDLRRVVSKWGRQHVARDPEKAVRRVYRLADGETITHKTGEDLVELLVDGIEAMRGNRTSLDERDGRTPPLGRCHSPPKAKGVRQKLIAELARDHSLSERTVRTAITKYNKFLKTKYLFDCCQ